MSGMNGENWVGYVLSLDCGDTLGCFQGEITNVDNENQTISLKKAFRNGLQCSVPEITLSARDIQCMKILKTATEVEKLGTNGSHHHVDEPHNPQNHHGHVNNSGFQSDSRNSPSRHNENKKKTSNIDTRKKTLTPKKTAEGKRRGASCKEDDCLNTPISSYVLETEFDFEKNLALFDKQAVFEQINSSSKSGGVKLVDSNRTPQKYRCDENVLDQQPAIFNKIKIPQLQGGTYFTDTGLVVPTISMQMKEQLLLTADKMGFGRIRQLELIGRTATEMSLQLLGGSHRLNPYNLHQKPTVVVLCGNHFQGAQALNCARHLANHEVNVIAFIPIMGMDIMIDILKDEIVCFKITSGKCAFKFEDLPMGPVDFVINGLDSEQNFGDRQKTWYENVVRWCAQCKAPVLSLDPPSAGVRIPSKWSLVSILPYTYNESVGSVYLCDVSIPDKVFKELGIIYASPFGSKFVIPLHPNKLSG